MSYGYSQWLVDANKKASLKSLGVTLGRLCIRLGVPVNDVAQELEVSRMTVYNWFWGRSVPSNKHNDKIAEYLQVLKKRQ
jgi:DNA-binding XRE family transcriptional regulator